MKRRLTSTHGLLKSLCAAVAVLLVLVGQGGLSSPGIAAESAAVVSLRVEGIDKTVFYNNAVAINNSQNTGMNSVIDAYNAFSDFPKMVVSDDNTRITAVGTLKEKHFGAPFEDSWKVRINGKKADGKLNQTLVKNGDDIVIYYGDASIMQFPEVDLSQMISNGIVKFTSMDENRDATGNVSVTRNPVVGAAVVWDGMKYTTNTNGEIIIDSTGAGVRHTVSIERYYGNGLPTVLRFAPGYYVACCFDDVPQDVWYYDAVMFVSDRQMMSGVTENDFAPDSLVTKAMFMSILGRIADAEVDQSADTGFPDVVEDGWSAGYIKWAVQNGIAHGNADGTFGQYQVLTREQFVVILYRFAGLQGYNTGAAGVDLSAYKDLADVPGDAVPAISWALAQGIILGTSGMIEPSDQVTRAQAAVVLQRFENEFIPQK